MMIRRRIEDFRSFSLFESHFIDPPGPGKNINEQAFNKMRACMFYLSSQYPFFSGLSAKLMIRQNNSLGTMATDGYSIHYNSKFVLQHTDAEVMWVIAHEILHCALSHFARCPKDKVGAKLWNIAADYAINQMLTQIDETASANGKAQPSGNPKNSIGKMPGEALYPGCGYIKGDDKFANMNAEQIIAELKKMGYTPPVDEPRPPKPKPGPPQEPKVGDVIYDTENKNYGVVTKYDSKTGEVDYDPIPKNKVKDYLKDSGSNYVV